MEDNNDFARGSERKGLAIAGLILGLTGFLCAFMYGWRQFAIVIAVVAFVSSLISLRKARRRGSTQGMQLTGMVASLLTVVVALWFLFTGPPEPHPLEGDKIPAKINEKGVPGSVDPNIDHLKKAVDSTGTD